MALTLPAEAAGLRFDAALARALPRYSRSRLKAWIDAGKVRVDGEAPVATHKVRGGERVVVTIVPDAPPATPAPEAIALSIVHEDDSLIVIDKPAGLVVHPGAGNRAGTLQNALVHHAPAQAGIPRAGIVHRLDKETSGLMVVAKTLIAQTDLVRQLQARSVTREYMALASGDIDRGGIVDAPIGRHPTRRTTMAVVAGGKPARTHYRVIRRFGVATLLACRLETGTHAPDSRASRIARAPAGRRSDVCAPQSAEFRTAGTACGAPRARASGHAPALRVRLAVARRLRGTARIARRASCTVWNEMSATALDARVRAAGLDWIVPPLADLPGIRALVTTRSGGVSTGEYATMNVARHSGDDAVAVAENRRRLQAFLPSPPVWLEQVHGTAVVVLDARATRGRIVADAAVTRTAGIVAAVQTADCLPVFFADRNGSAVGIAHAGWRGLAAGILEATVRALQEQGVPPQDVAAWIGPGIGPRAFEVGADVHAAFCARDPAAAAAFVVDRPGKWKADLYALARARLAAAGVGAVQGGGFCTHDEPGRFFSYRRSPQSGRMASLVWLEQDAPTLNV